MWLQVVNEYQIVTIEPFELNEQKYFYMNPIEYRFLKKTITGKLLKNVIYLLILSKSCEGWATKCVNVDMRIELYPAKHMH